MSADIGHRERVTNMTSLPDTLSARMVELLLPHAGERQHDEDATQCLQRILREHAQLHRALSFAKGVIEGAEAWSTQCDKMIGAVLAETKPPAAKPVLGLSQTVNRLTRDSIQELLDAVDNNGAKHIAIVGKSRSFLAMVLAPAILKAAQPKHQPSLSAHVGRVRWPNGAEAILFDSGDAMRMAGCQFDVAWLHEPQTWPNGEEMSEMVRRCLRLGEQRLIQTNTLEQAAERMIQGERNRQRQIKGYSVEHDDQHVNSELLKAGVVYWEIGCALAKGQSKEQIEESIAKAPIMQEWPFEPESLKIYTEAIVSFVRAGALCTAEMERTERCRERGETTNIALASQCAFILREATTAIKNILSKP